MSKLEFVEVNPSAKPTASIIWLHGLGADGHDFVNIVPELNLPKDLALRFVFPHAPVRPVTLNAGYEMRAWYDIKGLDAASRQDEVGIQESTQAIHGLIEKEKQLGIPVDRIILGGFSQGGAIALYCGLRYPQRLAGIMALSTYLPLSATLPQEISEANRDTSIFMVHGNDDQVLPLQWALGSRDILLELAYPVEFKIYPMPHSVCAEEIKDIANWIKKVLETKHA